MALVVRFPILQIVGFQNSGKTTVVSNMIQFASDNGYKLGAIKHHGHGGTPDRQVETKDSGQHLQSGAMISGVEGGGELHITAQKATWQLDEILSLYQAMNIDGIIVEGYKKERYPKIVMLREKRDLHLLDELEDIVGVIHDQAIAKSDVPQGSFLFTEKERYCSWFLDFLRR